MRVTQDTGARRRMQLSTTFENVHGNVTAARTLQ